MSVMQEFNIQKPEEINRMATAAYRIDLHDCAAGEYQFGSVEEMKLTCNYADAMDTALMMCRQRGCDADVYFINTLGSEVKCGELRRATSVMWNDGTIQSVLDSGED